MERSTSPSSWSLLRSVAVLALVCCYLSCSAAARDYAVGLDGRHKPKSPPAPAPGNRVNPTPSPVTPTPTPVKPPPRPVTPSPPPCPPAIAAPPPPPTPAIGNVTPIPSVPMPPPPTSAVP